MPERRAAGRRAAGMSLAWLVACAPALIRDSQGIGPTESTRSADATQTHAAPPALNTTAVVTGAEVAALRRCSTRGYDHPYLTCIMPRSSTITRMYRFLGIHGLPQGQPDPRGRPPAFFLTQGFDSPACSFRSEKGLRSVRACEFAGAPFGGQGEIALLVSHPWGDVFQHFLEEALPRALGAYSLLREAVQGEGPDRVRLYITPATSMGTRWQREALQMAGVPAEMISAWPGEHASGGSAQDGRQGRSFEQLWVVDQELAVASVWRANRLQRYAFGALHATARRISAEHLGSSSTPRRLVYFNRDDAHAGKQRQMVNERAVVEALGALGFETEHSFGRYSLAQRAVLLGEARVVVHMYGAGICNILFGPSAHTRWLFLCSPSFCRLQDHAKVSLASIARLRHAPEVMEGTLLDAASPDGGVAGAASSALNAGDNRPFVVNVSQMVSRIRLMLAA